MGIYKLWGISEYPSKADKSAVGAINRPLQLIRTGWLLTNNLYGLAEIYSIGGLI